MPAVRSALRFLTAAAPVPTCLPPAPPPSSGPNNSNAAAPLPWATSGCPARTSTATKKLSLLKNDAQTVGPANSHSVKQQSHGRKIRLRAALTEALIDGPCGCHDAATEILKQQKSSSSKGKPAVNRVGFPKRDLRLAAVWLGMAWTRAVRGLPPQLWGFTSQAMNKQYSCCKDNPAGKAFSKTTYAAKAGKRPRQRSRP